MSQLKGLDGRLDTGRQIYDMPSITGLNRVPVTILSSYILAKASITSTVELPFTLEELTEELLVDGPHINAITPLAYDDEHICGVWASSRDSFTLRVATEVENLFTPVSRYVLREFELQGDSWKIEDYELQGNAYQPVGLSSTPAANITYVHNPVCPVGILMPAQVTYNALEENAVNIRRFQTGASAKVLFYGNVRNKATAVQDLDDDDKDYAFVGGSDVRGDRLGSTAQVDQLMTASARLEKLYYRQVHVVDMETVQRPSGEDRSFQLGPMLRFIDAATAQVTRVLEAYGAEWRFERIHTTDVLARTQQLDLLERQLALAVIDQAQFKERAGEL